MSKNKYGCTMSFIFIKKNFLIIIIMLVHNFCLLFSNSNVMWNACVKGIHTISIIVIYGEIIISNFSTFSSNFGNMIF